MLQCKKCNEKKELCWFYKHPQWLHGVTQPCKECKKVYARSTLYRLSARVRDYERYHKDYGRKLYAVRSWMNARCYNSNNHHYRRYWEKWVTVERKTFAQFKKDMYDSYISHGETYWFDRKWTQIDRIDWSWNYARYNCRRVTAKENANNKKKKL